MSITGQTFLLTIGTVSLILSICLCCIFYCVSGSSEDETRRIEARRRVTAEREYHKVIITSLEQGPPYPRFTPPYPVGNPIGMPQPSTSPTGIDVTNIMFPQVAGPSNAPDNVPRPSETVYEDGPPPSYAEVMKAS